ncbi:zinc finger, CCHC-type containing protein [Tanacetum coccineum]
MGTMWCRCDPTPSGESLSEAWTCFKDLLQKVPHHGIDLWLQVKIFYDHVNPATRRTIDQSAGEETDHVFGLADGTKSYPIGIVKNVEVHIGKVKLLEDFYVIDMEKDPETPLLVGRGFLVTASAVIDCKKAKIAVREGVTRSIFGVKEINLGDEEVPYWTTLGK